MRNCKRKSPKEYAHRPLQNRVLAVRVLEDFAVQVRNLGGNTDKYKVYHLKHVVEQNDDQGTVRVPGDHSNDSDDTKPVISRTNVFEILISATEVYSIAS